MNLAPGGEGTVVFNVALDGSQSDIGIATITILRNNVVTAIPVTIDNSVTGRYVGSFDVPANWQEYDVVTSIFELEYGLGAVTRTIECPKSVGVVTVAPLTTELIAELLTADQVRTTENGVTTITYYEEGSNQTQILHRQVQTGDPCEDATVSLISS